MLGFFKEPPPPPPPPPPSNIQALLALGAAAFAVVLVVGVIVQRKWKGWVKVALEKSFDSTDLDKSGNICRSEFHVAVLELYLQLHLYGLNVRSPHRQTVLALFDAKDRDKSGNLNRAEFDEIVTQMLAHTISRLVTQLGLTVLAPVSAAPVSLGLRKLIGAIGDTFNVGTPQFLAPVMVALPPSFDESLVCMALIMLVSPALSMIDRLNQKWASRAPAKQA